MLTTILEETVNGWIVTIYNSGLKVVYVYETYHEARDHRNAVENVYVYGKIQEVKNNAITL